MEAKDEEDEFKAAVDRIKNNKSSDMLKMLEKSFLKKSYKYKEKDLKKLLKMISDKMKKLKQEVHNRGEEPENSCLRIREYKDEIETQNGEMFQ